VAGTFRPGFGPGWTGGGPIRTNEGAMQTGTVSTEGWERSRHKGFNEKKIFPLSTLTVFIIIYSIKGTKE
jgi:hypothetical protein